MKDLFGAIDAATQSGSPSDALEILAQEFRANGRYDLLFEARGMAKRVELGLPLIQTEASSSFPEPERSAYEQAVVAAARETGELYLQAGNIPAGYRYLRAIGETALVAAAIETAQPEEEHLQDVIAIAFQEGVHPAKGLELILKNHGMCQAITAFGMYAVVNNREQCLALLVRSLYSEVVERISRVIEHQEGSAPAGSLRTLLDGRAWLFGEYDYYVDTSHLNSVLGYAAEIRDVETLRLLDELCEYGEHLSQNFSFDPSQGHYVRAVLRENVDEHLRYFDCEERAQTLVALLGRLGRHEEALEAFVRYFGDEPGGTQLAFTAGRYDRMLEIARERGDVLSYTAARLLEKVSV